MTPRIRSLLPAAPFARRAVKAAEPRQVFREFVETLQKLDRPAKTAAPAHPRKPAPTGRARRNANGYARPGRRPKGTPQ